MEGTSRDQREYIPARRLLSACDMHDRTFSKESPLFQSPRLSARCRRLPPSARGVGISREIHAGRGGAGEQLGRRHDVHVARDHEYIDAPEAGASEIRSLEQQSSDGERASARGVVSLARPLEGHNF